jgi:hypothetical protein
VNSPDGTLVTRRDVRTHGCQGIRTGDWRVSEGRQVDSRNFFSEAMSAASGSELKARHADRTACGELGFAEGC